MTIEDIAQVCHEANRAYCTSLGDNSQPPWEDAPEWQRKSARDGVKFVLANHHAPVSANHEAWMAAKLADGWQWGPKKDPEKKLHPCLVPFGELTKEQQAKDHLFRAIVVGLVGFVQETLFQ